jgi:hypothetical protein
MPKGLMSDGRPMAISMVARQLVLTA